MNSRNLAILKEKTVLSVDDDPATCKVMNVMLKHFFNKVFIAQDGKEALEIYEKQSPDIIITDIEMPVMGGIELLRKIKAINPLKPVIIVTAYEDETHEAKNADAILIKPIARNDLLEAIAKLFNHNGLD